MLFYGAVALGVLFVVGAVVGVTLLVRRRRHAGVGKKVNPAPVPTAINSSSNHANNMNTAAAPAVY